MKIRYFKNSSEYLKFIKKMKDKIEIIDIDVNNKIIVKYKILEIKSQKLRKIIDKYKMYDISYIPSHETLLIRKSIPVKDFVDIKNFIKTYKLDIKDIIVGG